MSGPQIEPALYNIRDYRSTVDPSQPRYRKFIAFIIMHEAQAKEIGPLFVMGLRKLPSFGITEIDKQDPPP